MPEASCMTGEEVVAKEERSPRDTLSMSLLVVYMCVSISNRYNTLISFVPSSPETPGVLLLSTTH
jgi:hypothetical protein